MKKRIGIILIVLALALGSFALVSCGDKNNGDDTVYQIRNGGFETGDLTGWTVESGNAFSDDCVTTKSDFGFEDDGYAARIKICQTGKWHLYGKAFDDSYESQRVGVLRSETFTLGGEGTISMKLAGGSLLNRDGVEKPLEKQCYVGVYLESGEMIARVTNRYFVKHDGNYDPKKYEDLDEYTQHTLSTDNYNKYTVSLKEYVGQKMFLRIVDEDPDFYYGYISVDDIRTLSSAPAQEEGEYFAKVRTYEDIEAPANDVANGDFETGNLVGWTVTEGDAFSHLGVNASPTWWKENIPYNRDGEYHYGFYNPTAIGRMRSNTFTLAGSGYISYKLGGCADNSKAYIRIMGVIEGEEVELARVSNYKFKDIQFPNVPNGLKLANMVQYYMDLSVYLGEKIFFEVVDENTDANDNGCVVLDSVKAYHEQKPVFDGEAFEVKTDLLVPDVEPDNEYQVKNGTFETGDLTGWEIKSGEVTEDYCVTDDKAWWDENLTYNRRGNYHFTTFGSKADRWTGESLTCRVVSEPFTVGGSGYMTFLMGGRGGYLALWEKVEDGDDVLLEKFYNHGFMDKGIGFEFNVTSFLCNMIEYKADISEHLSKTVYLEIVDDNHSHDFNVILLDGIITYYEEEPVGDYRPAIINGELKELIESAKAIERGDYTQASYDALSEQISAAEAVANNGQNHAEVINAATTALREAIDSLTLKVPEAVAGADKNIIVRKNGAKTISISDYVNNASLSGVSYSVSVTGDGLSVDTDTPTSEFTISATDTAENGTATLTVTYNDETAFTVEFVIAVTEGTFTVDEAPEKNVDLFTLDGFGKVGIDVSVYAHIAESGTTLTYSAVGANGVGGIVSDAQISGSVLTVTNATKSEGNGTVTVKVSDTANGIDKEFTLTLKYYDSTPYRLANGGFDNDLDGWTLSNPALGAVNSDSTYWTEQVPFNNDGKFFNALAGQESAFGTLTSSTFTLSGSGYITYKFGGAKHSEQIYLDIIERDTGNILKRFRNNDFSDSDPEWKVRGCTLVHYKADLSEFIGKTVYIRISDYGETDYGLFFADSFVTYYETAPTDAALHTAIPIEAPANILRNKYELYNGGFETGNLEGWSWIGGDANARPAKVSRLDGYWGDNKPYNKDGNYLFTGLEGQSNVTDPNLEGNKGVLRSDTFTLHKNGWVSFKLGAGGTNTNSGGSHENEYIRFVNAATGEVLGKFHNDLANLPAGASEGYLIQYRYQFTGMESDVDVYVEIVDNATGDWGLIVVDSIITDYDQTAPTLTGCKEATNAIFN